MFGNKQDKKFVEMLQKENKKLEAENKKLLVQIRNFEEQREEVKGLKDHYHSLIQNLEEVKTEYKKKFDEIKNLEAEYRKALDEVIKNIGK